MNNDHRSHAKDMDLLHLQDDNPGLIFWHPMGWRLYKTIENYMRQQHEAHGYMEIHTPSILSRSLWETSGHWEKFREGIFVTGDISPDPQNQDFVVMDPEYCLKPMSCPAHIQIFGHVRRSYRELPMRLFEFGEVHRNETSGSLSGIMRLREFTQDDAHIFCRKEHILGEAKNYIEMLREVYSKFGYNDVKVKLSTRPIKRAGSDEVWDAAEAMLAEACNVMGLGFEISPGEGAFYGPKLEFTLVDALGRDWQCGTFQLDFVLPVRFGLSYQHEDGAIYHSAREEHQHDQVVMIHHAVLGSMERWIGVLLESTEGRLPPWLAPVQAVVCTISEKADVYAQAVAKCLGSSFRVECDLSAEKIGAKIRKHSERKVPFILVVGEKEVAAEEVNVRALAGGSPYNAKLSDFIMKALEW
jgi:threonyl-tRNA synthetase